MTTLNFPQIGTLGPAHAVQSRVMAADAPTPESPTPLADLTDEQLLGAYRTGRLEAFEMLVARYRPELLHFLIRFAGNRAAGEDLFQEAFLQVHISADTFDVSKRFKPWLLPSPRTRPATSCGRTSGRRPCRSRPWSTRNRKTAPRSSI